MSLLVNLEQCKRLLMPRYTKQVFKIGFAIPFLSKPFTLNMEQNDSFLGRRQQERMCPTGILKCPQMSGEEVILNSS